MWQGARGPALVLLSLLIAAAAAAGPAHHAADWPFAGHMLRLMLLMDVAAPLLVLGLPERCWCGFAPAPAVAAVVHAVAMWGWHLPSLFLAANALPGAHAVMFASFAAAGLVFWRAALPPLAGDGGAVGAAVFWMFMTVMHTGLLGALISFAPRPLYGAALADQQLGGLTMWVGGTGVYTVAGVALAAAWLRAMERA